MHYDVVDFNIIKHCTHIFSIFFIHNIINILTYSLNPIINYGEMKDKLKILENSLQLIKILFTTKVYLLKS